MFIIYFHINFNTPASSGLLVVGKKLRTEEKLCSTTIILWKKWYNVVMRRTPMASWTHKGSWKYT